MIKVKDSENVVAVDLRPKVDMLNRIVAKLKHDLFEERARWDALKTKMQKILFDSGVSSWEAIQNQAEIKRLKGAITKLETEINRLIGLLSDADDRSKARERADSVINHDLRSSLITAITVPELLLEDKNLTDFQRELLEGMKTNATRMLRLVTLFQSLYKMERGEFMVDEKRVDMTTVVRDVLAGNSKMIQAKSIDVVVHILRGGNSSTEPVCVHGDETLLYFAVNNLITNAMEASRDNDKVTIDIKENNGCEVHITNRGEVPASIRDKFFDKYVTSGKKQGTGLGTYSAMLIVKAHGGDILLDSSTPGYTKVNVRLPLCK